MTTLLRHLDNLIKGAVAFSIFLIMVIVCIQIFHRFILNDALPWPEEASRFLMIWALFIGGAYAFLDRDHASIEYLSKKLPGKASVVVEIANNVLIILFLSVIVYGGAQQMIYLGGHTTGALGISRAIPYAAIPVSGLIYIAFAVRLILKSLSRESV